tara:strand:+ start:12765 stop:14429 length:1665 start_codon:yes stop_codon:yes gene_type:complete
MAENRRNPYSNTEIIDNDVIAGYAYKYLGKFWNKKVDGEDFLTILYSVLEVESGFNKFIKSRGNETSYGLFQINWGDKTNRNNIYNNYPQFREAGLMNVPVEEMTPDQHNTLAELMSDLDFQFDFARFLMEDKEKRNLNLFSDWSAYTNNPPVNGTGPYKPLMTKYSQVSNSYENANPADLIKFADDYTPTAPVNPPGGDDIGGTDPADTNLISGQPTDPAEKWKQIKQYYGGEFYDYENDKWIGDYENQAGYRNWFATFQVGLVGDPNASYVDWFKNSFSDKQGNLDKEWNALTNQQGFFNPFQLSALKGPPTMADTVKIAVYNRFLRSASNAGFSATVAQSMALQHLANPIAIDRMNRAVGYAMERNLSVEEIINIVSHDISNYQHEQDRKDWAFRIPDYQDTTAQEVASLNEKINKKVSSVLLQDSPYLTDEIRRAYTDYKIINPNTQVSIEDFSMPFIKQTDRYKRIYHQKPAMFSPEQYINQYVQGVGSVMAPGDSNYQEMIASQASMGGTAQEAQTGAFFGSASVGLGDTFRNKVSSLGERVGALFNK